MGPTNCAKLRICIGFIHYFGWYFFYFWQVFLTPWGFLGCGRVLLAWVTLRRRDTRAATVEMKGKRLTWKLSFFIFESSTLRCLSYDFYGFSFIWLLFFPVLQALLFSIAFRLLFIGFFFSLFVCSFTEPYIEKYFASRKQSTKKNTQNFKGEALY